jgi:5-formyltetrahydrofolate cyclo-ligase
VTAKAQRRRRHRLARRQRPATAVGLAEVACAADPVRRLLTRAAAGEQVTATAYAALAGEPDLDLLRAGLRAAGVRVLLPVVTTIDGLPGLAWAVDDDTLAPGARTPTGVRLNEPTGDSSIHPGRLDMVFLPATAVDRRGHRLGQGAGYYDRTGERLGWTAADGPLLVAVVHDDEVVDEVPHERHDARVHAVLTPRRWIQLSR